MRSMPVLALSVLAAFAGFTPAETAGADRCGAGPRQVASDAAGCAKQRDRDTRVLAERVQILLSAASTRRSAGYSESRRRCQNAIEVAALCGTYAADFSCGEGGFLPAAPASDGTQARPIVSNGRRYQMRLCSLQATNGEP